jgi:hypothetical protein
VDEKFQCSYIGLEGSLKGAVVMELKAVLAIFAEVAQKGN